MRPPGPGPHFQAMKIHLNQISEEGLHVEGEEPSSILEFQDITVTPVSPVHYSLDVGISEGGLFATGTVGVDLECTCVACLERFTYALELPGFALQMELTGRETVDLTDPVREDILLALPPHPHCDWNGERACKGAAAPINKGSATDATPETDDDSRKVWGALDQLKLK